MRLKKISPGKGFERFLFPHAQTTTDKRLDRIRETPFVSGASLKLDSTFGPRASHRLHWDAIDFALHDAAGGGGPPSTISAPSTPRSPVHGGRKFFRGRKFGLIREGPKTTAGERAEMVLKLYRPLAIADGRDAPPACRFSFVYGDGIRFNNFYSCALTVLDFPPGDEWPPRGRARHVSALGAVSPLLQRYSDLAMYLDSRRIGLGVSGAVGVADAAGGIVRGEAPPGENCARAGGEDHGGGR